MGGFNLQSLRRRLPQRRSRKSPGRGNCADGQSLAQSRSSPAQTDRSEAATDRCSTARSGGSISNTLLSSRAGSKPRASKKETLHIKLEQVNERLAEVETEFLSAREDRPESVRSALLKPNVTRSHNVSRPGTGSCSSGSRPGTRDGGTRGGSSQGSLYNNPANWQDMSIWGPVAGQLGNESGDAPSRRRRPLVADEALENDWASSLFEQMPSIRRTFAEQSSLRMTQSAPSLDGPMATTSRPGTGTGPPGPCSQASLRRPGTSNSCQAASSELGSSHAKELFDYFPEQTFVSQFTSPLMKVAPPPPPIDDLPPVVRTVRRANFSGPAGVKLPDSKTPVLLRSRYSLDSDDDSDDGKDPYSNPGRAGPQGRRPVLKASDFGPVSLAAVAIKLKIPLDATKASADLFRQQAIPYGQLHSGDILRDGRLDKEALEKVVCTLMDVSQLEDLPPEVVQEAMQTADEDGSGLLDFEEFASWYQQRAFSDYVNLSKDDRDANEAAKKWGMPVADVEHCKKLFDKFDKSGNGFLDYEEFRDFLNSLLGGGKFDTSKNVELPETRVTHFWKLCDLDGTHQVDFKEFVHFYVQHFEAGSVDPSLSFYSGIRKNMKVGSIRPQMEEVQRSVRKRQTISGRGNVAWKPSRASINLGAG